ncbi:class I SAM-dependent methyltransferase [bacterium]|nr:class I SAM-dependent methyltransferase [bacterium]
MTGDQRIGKGNLRKIICPDSGIVANETTFTPEELEVLYGKEYELNTLGKEEHFFYTTKGPVARSHVFADWIEPYLPDQFHTLIEIGCGEGNFLKRLTQRFPNKNIMGFDGSHKASELAKSKGLNVQQKLILGNELLPKSDVFILINVIEHIEDITLLISNLKNSLKDSGRIIFCLPIQDYGGYDIFFAEHVWHFTSNHFLAILEKNGLKIVHSDTHHPVNHGIGLFVCEQNQTGKNRNTEYSDIIEKNLNFWETNFKNLDDFLMSKPVKKIAIFGAGEVSTLFLTFTSLGKQNIVACIDDTKQDGELKHGIPIHNSEWLRENKIDLLLLTVNKKYHKMIEEKLAGLNLNIRPIY